MFKRDSFSRGGYARGGQHPRAMSGTESREVLRKTPCPTSLLYDSTHMTLCPNCPYLHTKYHWEAYVENRVILISDSILKWVREMKYLETEAVPGLKLEDALAMIVSGELKTSPLL